MWQSMHQAPSTRPSVRLDCCACYRPASSCRTIRRSWWKSSRTTGDPRLAPSTGQWTWTGASWSASSFRCTQSKSDWGDNEMADAIDRLNMTELLNGHQIHIDVAADGYAGPYARNT